MLGSPIKGRTANTARMKTVKDNSLILEVAIINGLLLSTKQALGPYSEQYEHNDINGQHLRRCAD